MDVLVHCTMTHTLVTRSNRNVLITIAQTNCRDNDFRWMPVACASIQSDTLLTVTIVRFCASDFSCVSCYRAIGIRSGGGSPRERITAGSVTTVRFAVSLSTAARWMCICIEWIISMADKFPAKYLWKRSMLAICWWLRRGDHWTFITRCQMEFQLFFVSFLTRFPSCHLFYLHHLVQRLVKSHLVQRLTTVTFFVYERKTSLVVCSSGQKGMLQAHRIPFANRKSKPICMCPWSERANDISQDVKCK